MIEHWQLISLLSTLTQKILTLCCSKAQLLFTPFEFITSGNFSFSEIFS